MENCRVCDPDYATLLCLLLRFTARGAIPAKRVEAQRYRVLRGLIALIPLVIPLPGLLALPLRLRLGPRQWRTCGNCFW